MKTSDDLFQLIKSMTKGEVRYYKLLARKYTPEKKNTSLQLFEAISKQENYDEEAIKQEFQGEKWLKYLAVEKYTLYKSLLNALANYQTYLHRNDPREVDLLLQIRMLQAKSLPNQCEKVVKKLRKKAKAKSSALYQYLANAWDRDLTHNSYELLNHKRMNFLIEEQKDVIERLYNSVIYQNLCDHFYYNYLDNPKPPPQEDLALFMANPLLQSVDKAIDVTGKFIYYTLFSYYYEYINDHQSAYKNVLDTIQVLEDYPSFRERCMPNYFLLKGRELFVINILQPEFYPPKLAAYKDLAQQFAFEVEAMQGLRDIHHYQLLYCETVHYCALLDLPKVAEYEALVKQEQSQLEALSFGFILVELYHYLAKAFFELELYDKTQYWVEQIELNLEKEVGKSMPKVIVSKFLQLCLLHELQEYAYLKNQVDALKRLMKRHKYLDDFNNSLLKFVRANLGKAPLHKVPKKVRSQLEVLKTKQPEQEFDEVLLFDVVKWMETKFLG